MQVIPESLSVEWIDRLLNSPNLIMTTFIQLARLSLDGLGGHGLRWLDLVRHFRIVGYQGVVECVPCRPDRQNFLNRFLRT